MPNKVSIGIEIDQNGQARRVFKEIDAQMNRVGTTAQNMGRQVESSLSFVKGAIIVEFFRRATQSALDFGRDAVDAFNKAESAALGLSSVSIFKGIAPSEANAAIKNLDLVRDGLLSLGEASQATQALLSRGFNLEDSIKLLKSFGDNAAFNRQSALSFGQAVIAQAQGVKQLNSQLLDAGGVTKNADAILKQYGFTLSDVDDKVKGVAALEAFKNGLLKEGASQTGNAAKLTATFSGQLARLDVAYDKLLQTIGRQIATNPTLVKGLDDVTSSIQEFAIAAATPGSELNKNLTELIDLAGRAATKIGDLISFVKEYAGEISALVKLGAGLGVAAVTAKTFGLLPSGGTAGKSGSETAATLGDLEAARGNFRSAQSAALAQARLGEASGTLRKQADEAREALARVSREFHEASRQASTFGQRFSQFVTGGLREGFAAKAGLVASLGALLAEVITGAIREAAEKTRDEVSKNVGLGFVGVSKSVQQREEELQTLLKFQSDIAKEVAKLPANEIRTSEFQQTEDATALRQRIVADVTGGTFTEQSLQQQIELTKKVIEAQKEVARFERILGSVSQLRQEGAGLSIGVNGGPSINDVLRDRGEGNFDQFTAKALQAEQRLNSLIPGRRGDAIKKALESINAPAASLISSEDAEREKKALDNLVTDFESQISSLQQKLSFDPVGQSIADTTRQLEEFTKRFGALGPVAVETGRKLIQAVGDENTFRAKLAQSGRLNDLITEQAKLAAGLGGQELRDAEKVRADRRLEIEKEIRAAQQAGDTTTQRALLEEFNKSFEADKLASIMRESLNRQLTNAQGLLSTATSDTQKNLALEQILAATSNIGGLTSEQIALREDALKQTLELQGKIAEQQAQQAEKTLEAQKENTDVMRLLIETLRREINFNINLKDDSGLPRNIL